jgi:hypothetical protein
LIITGEGIQEAKKVTAGGGVNDLIYPWERIGILRIDLVETSEIYTEAPTAISLGNNHRISNPHGVGYLAYQLGLLQLLDFLDDEVLFLLRLLPCLLLHRVCLRAHG